MKYDFRKNYSCHDSLECSNLLLDRLETILNLKLHAETESEIGIEGSLSILHEQGNHQIRVEIYQADQGRLRRPITIPTHARVSAALETVITKNPSFFKRIFRF